MKHQLQDPSTDCWQTDCYVLLLPRRFVARFDALLSRIRGSASPLTIAVVGGGAGGVELALALAYRMKQERAAAAAAAAVAPSPDWGSDVVKCVAA